MVHDTNRRTLLASIAGGAVAGLAGCLGEDDGEVIEGEIPLPSIIDRSGPVSEVGIPISNAERDVISYLNEEEYFDYTFQYEDFDAGYEVDESLDAYQDFVADYDPGAILGAGTPDANALVSHAAQDEVVYMVTVDPDGLVSPDAPYTFIPHTPYSNYARIGLEYVAETDPGARVGFVRPDTDFGESVVPAADYAEELDVELGRTDITMEFDATSGDRQAESAQDDDLDYVIHHTIPGPNQIFLSSVNEIYPELTVIGTNWAYDEGRIQESPETFEGHVAVTSTKTFREVVEEDTEGAEIVRNAWDRNHDESYEDADPEIANLNYIRGVSILDLLMRGMELADEAGGDLESGPDVRDGLFSIEDYDGWEVAPTRTLTEDDPRPSMAARVYEIEDATMEFQDQIELERRTEWIPEEL